MKVSTMKVKDLIKLLNNVDKDLDVFTEGCDCYGDVTGITIKGGIKDKYILITRTGGA